MIKHQKYIVVILFFLLASSSYASIKLPVIFGNGMVLQRDTEFDIHGWASPGEKVQLSINDQKYTSTTDENGNWIIQLPPQKAGGPFELVFSGENEIRLKNVLFGDVWFCSGQSNMVLPMERVKERYPDEIANADYPEIRNFFVPTTTKLMGPANDLPPGEWKEANPEDVLTFSAVAYFFSRKIYQEYGVPIGLINSSVGGTPIEAWISESGFKDFPEILEQIQRNKNTIYIDSLKQARRSEPREIDDRGLMEDPKWYENNYVPKHWYNINVPGYWEDQGVRNLNGVVWYRRVIDVPKSMTGVPAKLFMGRIVDADFVYINGEQVGNITYQYPPRRYNIPTGVLKAGKNTIVIRVLNYGGKGGFVPDKPYYLTANNEEIDLKGTWQYKVGDVFKPAVRNVQSFSEQNQPTALYNAMVAPVTDQKIKGILWYQGETNAWNPEPYESYMEALIKDWRTKWQNIDLPFLYVQLANFMEVDYLPVESKWAELRFAQFQALSVQNTAMAVTIDLGEWNDIHPLNKKDVGERLALGAMKLAYGEDVVYSGPLYRSAQKTGNKIILEFSSTGSGLTTNDGEQLRRFEVAGPDGKFVWANAKINNNTVIVWSDSIDNPVQVRYAWADNPRDANLYNEEGLPASPFQTSKLK